MRGICCFGVTSVSKRTKNTLWLIFNQVRKKFWKTVKITKYQCFFFWILQDFKTFFKSGGFIAELVSFFTRNYSYLHCIFTMTWFKKHYQIHGAQISRLKWPDWFFSGHIRGSLWLKVFLEFAARSNASILNNIVFVCI